MINWNEHHSDNISRHIRVTNAYGRKEFVDIQNIRPILQSIRVRVPYIHFLISPNYWKKMNDNLRRLIHGWTKHGIQLAIEDSKMILLVNKTDYALNPMMVRAVLNGYHIDMTEACTLFR